MQAIEEVYTHLSVFFRMNGAPTSALDLLAT